jgi:hypothetical protein
MDPAALLSDSAVLLMNTVASKLAVNPNSENALKFHQTVHAVERRITSALAAHLASVAQKLVGAVWLLGSVVWGVKAKLASALLPVLMALVGGMLVIRVSGASLGSVVQRVDGVAIRRTTAVLLKDALPVVSTILILGYARSLEEVWLIVQSRNGAENFLIALINQQGD